MDAETRHLPIKNNNNKLDLGRSDIKALAQRLKGKKGRFRGNLSGKRANFTGFFSKNDTKRFEKNIFRIFLYHF